MGGKVTVVGAGFYGSTTALRLAEYNIFDTVVLTDILEGKPEGLALDMNQSRSIEGFETKIIGATTSPEGAAYNLDMFGDWPRQLKIDCLYSSLRFTEAHEQLLLLGQEFETRSYRAKQLEVCEAFAEYERSKIPAIEAHEPIILDDVTFIIPVRIETADQLANVKALCRQLTNNYRAKLLIGCEAPD